MTDAVEVKLGADTGQATASTKDASISIAESLNAISAALTNFGLKNQRVVEEAAKNNATLSRSFAELRGSISKGFDAVGGVVEKIRGISLVLTTALAGGMLWKEAVGGMIEFAGEVQKIENALGQLSDQATQTVIALKLIGKTSDDLINMNFKLARAIKNDEEELNRIGVVTRDASGHLLTFQQIQDNAFTAMQSYKAGVDQAEFALTAFGRSASEVYDLMVKLPNAQQRAAQLMHDLGIEMGPERQAAIRSYKAEVAAFKVALESIGDKIGEAVLPSLKSLATWFNENGPAIAEVMINAVKIIITALDTLAAWFKASVIAAANWAQNLVSSAEGAARGTAAAILASVGNFAAAARIQQSTNAKIVANNAEAAREIEQIWKDLQKRLATLWTEKPIGQDKGPGPLKSGDRDFTPKPKGGAGESEVAGWDNVLKQAENAYNNLKLQQGSFEIWSIEMTRDYWRQVLDFANLSAKDRLEIENKFFDAERAVQIKAFNAHIAQLEAEKAQYKYNIEARIAIAEQEYQETLQRFGDVDARTQEAYKRLVEERQKLADQRMRIDRLEAKSQELLAQRAYETGAAMVQQAVALRQISAQQAFAIESQLEDQLYAVKKAALDKERSDAEGNVVLQREIDNQLIALETDYQKRKTQIANQAELDRQQFALQAAQATQDAFATFIQNATSGAMKVGDAFKTMLRSIASEVNKLAAQDIAKQLLGPGTEGGGFLNKIFGSLFGGGAGPAGATQGLTQLNVGATTASTALTTMSTTISSAVETALTTLAAAADSAAAALSSIQASGAAGGLGGGGGGLFDLFGGGGDLFAGGFDFLPAFDTGTPYVPQDMVAVIHKGEAVVPAKYNKPGVAGQNSAVYVTNHNHFSGAPDGRTMDQIAAAQARGIQRGMRKVM